MSVHFYYLQDNTVIEKTQMADTETDPQPQIFFYYPSPRTEVIALHEHFFLFQ